jgi:hypothetical protein
MKKKNLFLVLVVLALVLPACQPAQTPADEKVTTAQSPDIPTPTNTPAPTDTLVPTDTALPTETPKPTNTPLPAGILFRDDFNGELQPGWEWQNENPDKWTFTANGWLQIVGEDGFILDGGENLQTNMLWRDVPDGDYVITVHVETKPNTDFQQTAIFLFEDGENFIVINRGFCNHCGGNGIYMDYRIQGSTGNYKFLTEAIDVYLRLESVGDVISGYYALQPDQWERLGRFGNFFAFRQVGLGVSNVDPFGADSDVVGLYDYFEISLP